MFEPSPQAAIWCILVLLGIGIVISLAAAYGTWREASRLPFYALRRQALARGTRYLISAGVLALLVVLAYVLWPRLVQVGVTEIVEPTSTATATRTLTPIHSPTITLTYTPTNTLGPPTATLTPSRTPTETGTPRIPPELLTPIPSGTITPPPNAVVGRISITPIFDYPAEQASDYFDPTAKTLYAVFEYNNFATGMQWSAVWYRDAAPIFIETLAWDGETGGWGYSELAQDPWPPGTYEVRVFAGERFLRSTVFFIVEEVPTETAEP